MLRVAHVGRHTVRPPRVRTPTFPLMPAAYTSALSVQVLDFESFGPLIQRGCLLCGSCSSGQRFVSSFLQIPPRDGHPCLQLTVPPAGSVEDLACSAHAAPPGESPCRAHGKKEPAGISRRALCRGDALSVYSYSVTVTVMVCVAVWPRESVAVTVMVAVPTFAGVTARSVIS